MIVTARLRGCVVMRCTAHTLRHWMGRRGRLDCGFDGLCLSGRLVTFVSEHIDKEAHRGVFVHVGERVGLVVACLLSLSLCHGMAI